MFYLPLSLFNFISLLNPFSTILLFSLLNVFILSSTIFIIDKPVKLDILNEIPPQVNEIPQHFIHEIKTIAYDVIGVNLFLLTLMRFLLKKVE